MKKLLIVTLKKELLELIKKIDKERDKKKSDIISKFQSDKYNHKNLKHNVDGDLNFSIDWLKLHIYIL